MFWPTKRSKGLVENGPQEAFFLFFVLILRTLGCLLTIFFPTLLFLLSAGLGLIGHPLVFHGCRVLQRNKFSFDKKYLCYLEYFQEKNGLLGCHLVISD